MEPPSSSMMLCRCNAEVIRRSDEEYDGCDMMMMIRVDVV